MHVVSMKYSSDRSFYYDANSFAYRDVGIELAGRQWIVFQTMSCRDVFVALSDTHDKFSGSGFYEVTFDWPVSTSYVLTAACVDRSINHVQSTRWRSLHRRQCSSVSLVSPSNGGGDFCDSQNWSPFVGIFIVYEHKFVHCDGPWFCKVSLH